MAQLTKKELEESLDRRFEEQARIINSGFEQTATKQDFKVLNKRFDKVEDRLQVVEIKLDRALYTETVHLEARIKRLEEKVGIKPSK